MSKKIHIGTSGWSYQHWKTNFFPEDLATKNWLNYFSSVFSTVEVNTTFYHLPLKTTIQNWYKQVPEDFLFSIKASRYITHQKRLKETEKSLELFYNAIKDLKEKMGPILFQLPPSFKFNKERLVEFIDCLDDDHRYVFEFRDESWFIKEVYDLLSKKNIALCITDLNGHLTPEEITSDFTYIRLHGPHKAYQGSYGKTKLNGWKKKISAWSSKKIEVFCYFDNDEKGYAVLDAKTLQKDFNL